MTPTPEARPTQGGIAKVYLERAERAEAEVRELQEALEAAVEHLRLSEPDEAEVILEAALGLAASSEEPG